MRFVSKGPFRVDIEERLGRRHLLGGAAVAMLPLLSGRVHASSTSSDDTSTTAGDTTTSTSAPPKRPTEADIELMATAQQAELTIRDLYDAALSEVSDWSATEVTILTTIREAHESYGQSISGDLGTAASNQRSDSLYDSLEGGFTGDRTGALEAMWKVESAAVALYTELLGELQSIHSSTLVASIQIAEARHSTVLADLAGQTDVAVLLVDTEEAALEVAS